MSSQPHLLQFLKIVLQTDGEACDGDIGDDFVTSSTSFPVKTKLSSSIVIVLYIYMYVYMIYSCHILTSQPSQPFKCQDSRQPSLRYGLSGR